MISSRFVKVRLAYLLDLFLTALEIAGISYPYPHLRAIIIRFTAFMIMWRLSTSPEPTYLSLAVFHITASVVLFLISLLKLFDVCRAGKSSEFQTKFNYLTGEPWKEEDAVHAQKKFDSKDWTMKFA